MAILGIDEVGRGPIAGPLVVGAVILPEVWPDWVGELKDSKKLTVRKREKLAELIWGNATVGLGWVMSQELDVVGMSQALRLATRRAVEAAQAQRVGFSQIVIDGKVNFLAGTVLQRYVSTVVKADNLVKEVSAASIVAKVARDKYMCELALEYPEYGFEKHVGYGTAFHRRVVEKIGVCPEHRLSFEPCKSLVGWSGDSVAERNVVKNTTKIGEWGEEAVCKHLVWRGHEIVARNHKTRFYEIDIVSVCEGKIYFTEVKYRKNDFAGGGLMAIDGEKQRRMRFAAESFLRLKKEFSNLDPVLAVADVTGADLVVRDWFVLS